LSATLIHNESNSGIDYLPKTYRLFHKISTSMEHLSGGITLQPQLKVTGKVQTFVLDTNVLLREAG
jgi:hypothetical protein